VRVTNNVFLALRGQPAGTVQHHPLPNPVLTVTAKLRSGALRNVPYVVAGQGVLRGILPGGKPPKVPSYFAHRGTAAAPGAPTRVEAPIRHPTISWLERREKRGRPLPAQPFVTVRFGRVIQPDPDDPVRIGVAVADATDMTHGHPITGRWLCLIYFRPLARASGGVGCAPPFRNGPLHLGSWFVSPITHFNGLAADGIVRVRAYLASGRRVDAALHDNVFALAVPQAELGGELVGYDKRGRVAAISPLPGNGIAKPCPPAEFSRTIAELPHPKRWEQIDLAKLTLAGRPILGKTPQQVEAILGKPTLIRPHAQITNGVAIPEFRYGGSMPSTLGLSITFGKKGARIFANSLFFQSPSLVDARLGHLLRMQPSQLQQAIQNTYSNHYRLYLGYGAAPSLGCTGTFTSRTSPAGLSFGLNTYRPSRPYLTIRANGGG
jgi:hypothetical protein